MPAALALTELVRHRDLHVQRHRGRWRVHLRPTPIAAGEVRLAAGERVK